MKLVAIPRGSWARRKGAGRTYIVSVSLHKVYRYYTPKDGKYPVPCDLVKDNATIWEYNDFIVCDKHGNLIAEEQEMKNENVNYIGGEYRVVEVNYDLGDAPILQTFMFKADIDMELVEGDIVCIEGKNGMALTKVVKCFENCLENADIVKKAKAWIVDKIDYSNQKKRKEATERREYIIQQLDERKQQVEAINMYQLLAAADPKAAKLLEELKELS